MDEVYDLRSFFIGMGLVIEFDHGWISVGVDPEFLYSPGIMAHFLFAQ